MKFCGKIATFAKPQNVTSHFKTTAMKEKLTIILTLLISMSVYGQKTDTITFFSQTFQQERTVYIRTPEFYKYQSDAVKLPVIYILDGQHEWFVNPLVTTIKYLQYTHEISQALLVIIPHIDRNTECGIKSLQGEILPLHNFITEELEKQLKAYNPNEFRAIIGHSFSASFALYSYLKSTEFYSSVIANTPLDHLEELIVELQKNENADYRKISISIGGIALDKDYYHRREFDKLKLKYSTFFNSVNIFLAYQSSHNAVPIVSTPFFLTNIFSDFSSRYLEIAKVNDEYQLLEKPKSVKDELTKIEQASMIGNSNYCPEIPDINGLASRYLSSGLNQYGISIYEMGLEYFPKYYEFHLALYELYLQTDKIKAQHHLNAATKLLEKLENDLPEQQEVLNEINDERKKNGW
jgi:predicted alpha/beta superfamily hydrolase